MPGVMAILAGLAKLFIFLFSIASPWIADGVTRGELKSLEAKVHAKKASTADLYEGISKIIRSSNAGQLSKLQSALNKMPYTGISSGVADQVLSRIKKNIESAQEQAEQHLTNAERLEAAADAQVQAYNTLSDSQKARAKTYDQKRTRDEKTGRIITTEETPEGRWDTTTAGGVIGQRAEDLANQAKEERSKAQEITERYI